MAKRYIIASILLLVLAGLLFPQLAADTHYLLSREPENITADPLEGWKVVLQDSRVLKFYSLYCAVTVLLLIWVLVSSNYLQYRSNMQRITPRISTPCAAGQGQYGTARWMKPEEISQFYTVWKIPKREIWFRDLIVAGKQSYTEVENASVKVEKAQ